MPLSAFIFLVALFAETNRQPFDMPESEADLVGGFHTEYGEFKWSLFFVAEYAHMTIGSGVFVLLFLGGWNPLPWIPLGPLIESLPMWLGGIIGISIFLGKTFFFIFLFMWVRWTLPRFRYDQVMKLGWQKLLPMAIGNLIFLRSRDRFHRNPITRFSHVFCHRRTQTAHLSRAHLHTADFERIEDHLQKDGEAERDAGVSGSASFHSGRLSRGSDLSDGPQRTGKSVFLVSFVSLSVHRKQFASNREKSRPTVKTLTWRRRRWNSISTCCAVFIADFARKFVRRRPFGCRTYFSLSGYTREEMVNNKQKLYELGGTLPDEHFKWDKKKLTVGAIEVSPMHRHIRLVEMNRCSSVRTNIPICSDGMEAIDKNPVVERLLVAATNVMVGGGRYPLVVLIQYYVQARD